MKHTNYITNNGTIFASEAEFLAEVERRAKADAEATIECHHYAAEAAEAYDSMYRERYMYWYQAL